MFKPKNDLPIYHGLHRGMKGTLRMMYKDYRESVKQGKPLSFIKWGEREGWNMTDKPPAGWALHQ